MTNDHLRSSQAVPCQSTRRLHRQQPTNRSHTLRTTAEQIKAVDPRSLLVLLVVLDKDVQAPDVLETNESEIESVTFDIVC